MSTIAFIGAGICALLGLIAWFAWETGTGIDIWFLWLFGNPSDPASAPLTLFSRLSLFAASVALGGMSLTLVLDRPVPAFLFDVALMLSALIAAFVGQRAFLSIVPPHETDRNYPFPSALGIFLIGASLLFVLNLILAH